MFDINLNNIRKGKSFFLIFLIIGLIFLFILGVVFIVSIIKLNNLDSTVLSKKVDVKLYIDDEGNMMYSPIYYYEVEGKNYICSSNVSSSNNPGKKNRKVYYNSSDPSDCMTEYSKSNNYIFLIFFILPLVFISIAVINIIRINKRIKAIMKLNKNGKLIKNLPYRLENTNRFINDIPIQRPVIDYTLSSGSTITLFGDPRYDKKLYDCDGMADLLIDETNPNNYFIDFEINRLKGNLPQDYYQLSTSDIIDSQQDQSENN